MHNLPNLPHPDEKLSKEEKAEALSWVAYIDGQVTDLVVCLFYASVDVTSDSSITRYTLSHQIIPLQSVKRIQQTSAFRTTFTFLRDCELSTKQGSNMSVCGVWVVCTDVSTPFCSNALRLINSRPRRGGSKEAG